MEGTSTLVASRVPLRVTPRTPEEAKILDNATPTKNSTEAGARENILTMFFSPRPIATRPLTRIRLLRYYTDDQSPILVYSESATIDQPIYDCLSAARSLGHTTVCSISCERVQNIEQCFRRVLGSCKTCLCECQDRESGCRPKQA
jgi:hypothetical protein